MAYNPWDTSPTKLDEETLKWLIGGGLQKDYDAGSRGIRDGYRYQGGNGNAAGWVGGDAGGWQEATPTTQWDRIAVDEQGRDIGRDYEAFDPTGNKTHAWISGGQTLLDRVAPFIPAIAATVMSGGAAAPLLSQGGGGAMSMADILSALAPADAAMAAGGAGLTEGMAALGGAAAGGAAGGAFQPIQQMSNAWEPITAETLGMKSSTGLLDPLAKAVPALSSVEDSNSGFNIPSTVKDWLPVAAGVIAGATTDKEGEQTAKREPWGPAQPLLKDLIAQGQELAKRDPFSPYKKQVMEQQAGLLSGINTQALPGLLQSLQGLSTPYKRGGGRGTPTLSGLPTQFDPMQIFKRGG